MNRRHYGQFEYLPAGLVPEARCEFKLKPVDLMSHWRRCSLLSDFVASYVALAYPQKGSYRESDMFNSLSTIFQELIENAAKFSRQRDAMIAVEFAHFDRLVVIEVQNESSPACAREFEQHIQLLSAAADPDQLFVEIIEGKARDDTHSGIGLLLLIKDYQLKIGVRFEDLGTEATRVTVRCYYFLGDE